MSDLTQKQQEALDAVALHGSQRAAAKSLGISRTTLQEHLINAQRKQVDPAIQSSMAATGTNLVPNLVWAKTKNDDGTSYSVLLKPPPADPVDIAKAMREAFEGMTVAPIVAPPSAVVDDECALYPLMDAHIGMHAWGKETGDQDYDLPLAIRDMKAAFGKTMARTGNAGTAILLIGGDFFHADDTRAETPASKHRLDVDGRFFKVLGAGIGLVADIIASLAAKHHRLIVRVLPGNHDPHSSMALTFALAERYRGHAGIDVIKDPRELFMFQWGRSAIFSHHGDKGKPQQMAMYFSDICPFWSATRHRHYFTGHVHHDQAKDFGAIKWESLRAFCPPDAYAASMGYASRRALQSITFHKVDGIVARAYDPIERIDYAE